MTSTSADDTLTSGSFSISINGSQLPSVWSGAVLNILIEQELNLPAMFAIRFNIISVNNGDWQGIDLDTFKPGQAVNISMGSEQTTRVIEGVVTSVEPEFGPFSTMVLRGYDRLYFLHFGSYQRTFYNLSDSAMVRQVISDLGLSSSCDSTQVTYPYVLQNNQTNYEFVQERRMLNDYELFVVGSTINFKKSAQGEASVLTLEYGSGIQELSLRLKVIPLGGKTTVVGWDMSQKQTVEATISSPNFNANMGGTSNGFSWQSAFPTSAIRLDDLDTFSTGSASAVAQAVYNESIQTFIEGEGRCMGEPNLKPGTNISFTGLGTRFSGLYYLTQVTHRWNQEQGYHILFKVRRTGV